MNVQPINKFGHKRQCSVVATFEEICEIVGFSPNVGMSHQAGEIRQAEWGFEEEFSQVGAAWGFQDQQGREGFLWCYKNLHPWQCKLWSAGGDSSLLTTLFGENNVVVRMDMMVEALKKERKIKTELPDLEKLNLYTVKVEMTLVIGGEDEEQVKDKAFYYATQEWDQHGLDARDEHYPNAVQVKQITSEQDVPQAWINVQPWLVETQVYEDEDEDDED